MKTLSRSMGQIVIWNTGTDTYHIIDKWGETTLCARYSAWGTANPSYSGRSRNMELVNLEYRDGGSICKRCQERMGRTLCRSCKRPLKASNSEPDDGYCQSCQ